MQVELKAVNFDTMRHIERVRNLLNKIVTDLLRRGEEHDQSKLESPEVEIFAEFTPKLAAMTYGSPEFNECKANMRVALEHHYAKNAHHPEHYPENNTSEYKTLMYDINCLEKDDYLPTATRTRLIDKLKSDAESIKSSVNNMTLLDVIEMLVDWKASSERHHDGNILKSIEINATRFGMSPQLVHIFENTARHFLETA
jgi:hypothetical protein